MTAQLSLCWLLRDPGLSQHMAIQARPASCYPRTRRTGRYWPILPRPVEKADSEIFNKMGPAFFEDRRHIMPTDDFVSDLALIVTGLVLLFSGWLVLAFSADASGLLQ